MVFYHSINKNLFILVISIFSLIKSAVVVHAYTPPLPPEYPSSTIVFEDEFEDGLGKWELARGSMSHWSINSSGALEATIQDIFVISELVPKDEYWQDEWQNYQIEFDYEVLTEADVNWGWGYQDEHNWCELHHYDKFLNYDHLVDGKSVYRALIIRDIPRHQVHHMVINSNQGEINVWMNNFYMMTFKDFYQDPPSGKVSLKATTGIAYPTQIRFDNFRVYLINEESEEDDEQNENEEEVLLSITEFKQNDDSWKDEEYDHALDWSSWGDWRANHPNNPPTQVTINHWGCALNSLAMIMNYHQLTHLPSGELLNPNTLNQWLIKEADGYVGEGSLNWLAGARLSRLISEEYSTASNQLSTLEYSRIHSDLSTSLVELLDENRPAIIQIPGHFLVGKGYIPAQEEQELDFYIADPAYSYAKFSEHQESLLSLIDYQPSNTDLSYLMAVYPSEVDLAFCDENGQELQATSLSRDTLLNPLYDVDDCLNDPDFLQQCLYYHSAPLTQLVAKPSSEKYQIELSSVAENQINNITLYLYDELGEVKMHDFYFLVGENSQSIQAELTYNKQDLSQFVLSSNQRIDFSLFQLVLVELDQDNILPADVYLRLTELASFALEVPDNNIAQERYSQLCLRIISQLKQSLVDTDYTLIEQSLIDILIFPD